MEGRLAAALALARSCQGHLTVLVDTPITRYVSMDPMGGGYVASAAMQQALADDDAHAAALDRRLADEGVPFSVLRDEAEPVDALAGVARLADLVVVSRSSGIGGEVAIAARAPVLVARDDGLAIPVARASIAWDGSNEAAMALRGAVPLLAGCSAIEVLTVTEKPGGFPAREALRYLEHHGIAATPRELARDGSTEATLAAAVSRSAPDILVMGAYGRSRMREFLFGGVTRHFLEDDTAPSLLMAH